LQDVGYANAKVFMAISNNCHCEERSDEAISAFRLKNEIASLRSRRESNDPGAPEFLEVAL